MATQVLSLEHSKKLQHILKTNFWAIKWDFLQLTMPAKAGTTGKFKFLDNSTFDADDLVIGFNTIRQNDAGTITTHNGKKLINNKVHDSSFLNLDNRDNRTTVRNMPLILTEPRQAENPMLRRFPDFIKISTSNITCANPSELVDDEEFALNVYYINIERLRCELDAYDCSFSC